jgi:heterodisulfide reductase subunit A-like polyferredoxin
MSIQGQFIRFFDRQGYYYRGTLQGFGICVSSCLAQAIEGRHFTSEELIAEIKGVLEEDRH